MGYIMKVDWWRFYIDVQSMLNRSSISILLLTIVLGVSGLYSQNRNRNWVFSDSIGLKFNIDGSVSQFTANLNGAQRHSCAVISNKLGQLQFYAGGSGTIAPASNSLKIFRGDNGLLANYPGVVTGLGSLTCQFFLPLDEIDTKYCFAHLEPHPNENRHMLITLSEIDASLDGGMGSFTSQKGIIVNGPTDTLTQGMYAIRHANGRDWWIITHQWGNNTFVIVLVDSNLNYEILRQNIGSIHSIDGQVYAGGNLPYFQFDAKRNKLIVNNGERLLEILDFDRCTGILSNPSVIYAPISMVNNPGLSFYYNALSPSGQFFYMVTFDFSDTTARLVQFDLFSSNIPNSKEILFSKYAPTGANFAQIGLGPDKKLYTICWGDTTDTTNVTQPNPYYLSIIEKPDLPYPACNFIPKGLWLNGRMAWMGIPDFIDYDIGPVDGSVCDTLGIDASNNRDVKVSEIKVYPNPSDGNITVGIIEQKFIIYNLVGSQVGVCESNHKGEVTLPNEIPDGIYIIQTVPQDKVNNIQYSKIQILRNK
jgi:hypothetical protein